MTVNARTLNNEGVEAVKLVFDTARERAGLTNNRTYAKFQNTDFEKVSDIIFDDKYTNLVSDIIIDPNKIFANRLELGLYLKSIIDKSSSLAQYENVGFWTWINTLYLHQILQPNKDKSEYQLWTNIRYIPDRKLSKLRWYRNLCYLPFYICSNRPKAIAEFFLIMQPYSHSDTIEQLWTADKDFSSSPGIVEVAKELYIDKKTKTYRKNYLGKGPGSARRLGTVIVKQWQMNYDVNMLTKDQVWDLLPKEFNSWKKISERE